MRCSPKLRCKTPSQYTPAAASACSARQQDSSFDSSRPPHIWASMHGSTQLRYVQDHILLDERTHSAPYFGSRKAGERMPYPSGHRDEIKGKIIQSARKLFNRHGFESVSLDQIMSGAGLT